jgi:hypothetical protein
MSLDNTSHPGGPGPDELVPSRYALRVGEIDVLVISDGVLPIPAVTLATNADSADLAAWLDDMFLPPGVPDVLRSAASRFLDEYRSQLRPFEAEYEVAPGVVACRTGGHNPGHSVLRLSSCGDRLTFAGDAFRCVPAVWDY